MQSNPTAKFLPDQRLRELIQREPALLMVLRRFSIGLGFGNDTVSDVCRRKGVHLDTFLAVANFMCDRPWRDFTIDLGTLIGYLKKSHDYFLSFALPSIRHKLIESVPMASPEDVGMLLLRYFDDYTEEVRAHMGYENSDLFPYVENLLDGKGPNGFNLASFARSHAPLAPKLEELKEIFVSHYQGNSNEDMLNSALFDIITLEKDLLNHCRLEDIIFVPTVKELELKSDRQGASPRATATEEISDENPELTSREKAIVRLIACGLSNKEIADKLCVSIHTVTTHRRNICAKLDIHSASGLTIYAIIHHLIDVAEIAPAK